MVMKFTKDHEWVRIDNEISVIGITDYAQKALGDVVSIELPKVGRAVKQGESFSIVDSMKASSEVYAPISGEVIESNTALNDNPQWINESCYEKGWIAKLKAGDLGELDKLMDDAAYKNYVSGLKH